MKDSITRANELEERLVDFASSIVSFRADYAEARGAESRADFIHKMRIVQKELNETEIWLRIIRKSSLISPEQIVVILAENKELSRIISSSITTAQGKANGPS